ncbi:hypothetical protein LXL04_007350 [Taraxacum kok-saghyz]
MMAMVKQLNIPDLTNEDMDVVRNMIEGGYDAEEISYTLGILRKERKEKLDKTVINDGEDQVDSSKQLDAEVNAEVDAAVPIQKKWQPSERIIEGKLKKFRPDKDEGGSSKDKAWVLE